jgi:hypothetical protein
MVCGIERAGQIGYSDDIIIGRIRSDRHQLPGMPARQMRQRAQKTIVMSRPIDTRRRGASPLRELIAGGGRKRGAGRFGARAAAGGDASAYHRAGACLFTP